MVMTIGNRRFSGNGDFSTLMEPETTEFSNQVTAALQLIEGIPLGAELLREMRGAKNTVDIVKTSPEQGNKCVFANNDAKSYDAACYKEIFLKTQELEQRIKDGSIAKNKYEKFFGADSIHNDRYKSDLTKNTYQVPVAHKTRRDLHATDTNFRDAFKLFDGSADSINDVNSAGGKINLLQKGIICYHMMESLTQGPGADAVVAWDPQLAELPNDGHETYDWMRRPTWLALGHELIHAWRIATGQCVFHPSVPEDYYEEAMTVGLPPYNGCKFTENRFREVKGEAHRGFYGISTKARSDYARQKQGAVHNVL